MSEELVNRLRKRFKQLRKWARRDGVSCYRVYDRDLPDHPATIDWYDGDVVLWTRRRKRDETNAADTAWQATVVAAATAALAPQRVFAKRRARQRGHEQYERTDSQAVIKTVCEGDVQLEVNLSDYLDTGLFLDHRPLRRRVGEMAAGKRFLNLFCYTGAFTVHAALGGAASSVSVDLSRTYLDWAARNLALNDRATPAHALVRADCLGWLEQADVEPFDLIVCDPPTFSNSKATAADWVVGEHWDHLLTCCHRLLRSGGRCFFSTNFRRFQFEPDRLPYDACQEISKATIPPDFRDRQIHRCWELERIA
jgi:23S rRNA G2069 N7-methylase RlmK/C1962 C5-methylase RlmI